MDFKNGCRSAYRHSFLSVFTVIPTADCYQHTPGDCMIKGHLQNQCLRTSFDPPVNSMPTPNLNISKEFHRPNDCPHLRIIRHTGKSLQSRHT